jgi:hypothetical protein
MVRFSTTVLLPVFRRLALASLGLLPVAASAQTISSFSPSQAPAGATVSIKGTDLGNIKSVMINGQPMRVAKASTISVDVIVPAAAATGRIRLTTSAGTTLTSTKLGITRQSSAVSYGQVSTSVTGTTATGNYSTPTTGDLDKDGLTELIQGQGDGTIRVFEQTAANGATFGTGFLLKNADGTTLDVGNFSKPTLADIDGDGLLELLVGEDTGNILRYEQVSTADAFSFTRTTLFTNPYGSAATAANGGSYPRPTVADLDNNGLLDVLVGSNDGTLRRYEQTAANAATFTDLGQMRLANGTVIDAGDVDKPLLTDYDGDGYLDMLLGNLDGNIVLYTQSNANSAIFRRVGNLTTNGSTIIDVGGYAAPAITDIDGDGLLDLFVGNASGTIYRFEQTQSAVSPTLVAGALTSPAPLPVVLTSFTGQAGSITNILRWTTATETNSDRFEVERSTDGQNFIKIGQLAAAGTTIATHSYVFNDAATATISYYRLRQVDLDGTSAYSPIVTLAASSTAPVASTTKPVAYPTVFTNELSVALPGAGTQAATVALLTADGRPVYSRTVQLGTAPQALAELPTLASGLYLLRIATAAGTTTQRLVRN